MDEEVRSGGRQDVHDGSGAAEKLQSAVSGGNMMMGAEAETEEVTQFVVASTEPPCRVRALEPAHGLVAAFDATVILLQSVVEITAVAVLHALAQRRADRTAIAVVTVGVTRSGVTPVTVLADRKNALAATMSRCSLNITSTSAPLRSMARYR